MTGVFLMSSGWLLSQSSPVLVYYEKVHLTLNVFALITSLTAFCPEGKFDIIQPSRKDCGCELTLAGWLLRRFSCPGLLC